MTQKADTVCDKIMDISLIGYGIYSYPQPWMAGWGCSRIEYGGHAESCLYEGHIWFPPQLDAHVIELLLMGMQAYWAAWVTSREQTGTALDEAMTGWYEHTIEHDGQQLARLALPAGACTCELRGLLLGWIGADTVCDQSKEDTA